LRSSRFIAILVAMKRAQVARDYEAQFGAALR
jgi:hypothetical protein